MKYNKGYCDKTRKNGGCLTRIAAFGIVLSMLVGGLSSCKKESSSKKNNNEINSSISILNNNDNLFSKNDTLKAEDTLEVVEEEVTEFIESSSITIGNFLDLAIDEAKEATNLLIAVKNAKKEAKIYLQNEGIIKLDYDGNFYINANKEDWQDIGFGIYDVRTGEYNKEALAKVFACEKVISSIDSKESSTAYQRAYYVDEFGKKQYCDSKESFYDLLPNDINNLNDLKNYLENYLKSVEGYIFSDDVLVYSNTSNYSFKHMSNNDYGTINTYESTNLYTRTRRI